MNILKNVKRSILAVLMVAVLIPTLVFTTMGVKAKANTVNPIQLYTSDTFGLPYTNKLTTIDIKVANWDCNKKVYVHYQNSEDLNWYDSEAKYIKTLDDGSEIWEATASSFAYGIKAFALKCEQNGQTYWDNNNYNNYTIESAGIAPVKAIRSINEYDWSNGKINIAARVQNYAFQKKVTVRYTTDNWATFQDAALLYSSEQPYNDGTELWNTQISLPNNNYAGFAYAIKYEVNGQTYWDNNFNRNYDSNYEVSHS